MKHSNIITASQWRIGHPEGVGFITSDLYYARVCTSFLGKIKELFRECDVPSEGDTDFALMLGHYIEDIVSGTHVFDSFRRIHQKMYGRKLPFYELPADYVDDDVNIEDIKFMVWDHVQQMRGNEAIINPDNAAIQYIAEELFPLICDVYEEAPEVTELYDFIYSAANYVDYIGSKKILVWLMLYNPLTASPKTREYINDEMSLFYEKPLVPISPNAAFYFISSNHLFVSPCRWLSAFTYQMLAEMLEVEGLKAEAVKLKGTRHTGIRNFKRIGKEDGVMILTDLEDPQKYRLSTDSFGEPVETDRIYITTDLASFDGEEWEINGSSWFSDKASETPTSVTDGDVAYNHYLKILKGKRVGYFGSFEEMRKKLFGNIQGTIPSEIRCDLENASAIMVFLNSNGTLNVSKTLAATIPDPHNPYFKGIDKAELLSSALNESLASSEMARYFHEQGWYEGIGLSSSVSTERGIQLFQDNFDFLMRYFRGAEYHTS